MTKFEWIKNNRYVPDLKDVPDAYFMELYDRATANGLHFEWATFDEGYGGKPEFLRELTARGQRFVGEVPRNFMGWVDPPS